MNLVGQYGLGLVLEAKNKTSRVLREAKRDFEGFKRSSLSNLEQVRAYSARIGDDFRKMRSGIFSGLQIMAGGAAILAPLAGVSKVAMDFEEGMAKIKSLLVTTFEPAEVEKNMKTIEDTIFKTGRNSMIPINDLVASMYDLLSADLSVDEAMKAVKATADLAVAGIGSMTEATDVQTSLLNTYGKRWGDVLTPQEKAIKISNILANTIAGYKTTLPKMSLALQYAIGPANALGVELSELTSVIGALQTSGLQASMAGTSLNAFFRSATKLVLDTGESIDGASISMEEYLEHQREGAKVMAKSSLANLQLADSAGRLLPIPDILEQIEKAFNIDANAAKRVAKEGLKGEEALMAMGIGARESAELQKAFGDEGSRALAVLLGQSAAIREKIKYTREANNLDKMTQARQEALNARLQMTRNSLQELAVTIGTQFTGDEKDLLSQIDEIIHKTNEWVESNPQTVKELGKSAGAIAGITVAIGGLRIGYALLAATILKHPALFGFLTGVYLAKEYGIPFMWQKQKENTEKENDWYIEQLKSLMPMDEYKALMQRAEGLNPTQRNYLFKDYYREYGSKNKISDISSNRYAPGTPDQLYALDSIPQYKTPSYYSLDAKTISPSPIYDSLFLRRLPSNQSTITQEPQVIEKRMRMDVHLSGNVGYDISQMIRAVKSGLEEEARLSESGEM